MAKTSTSGANSVKPAAVKKAPAAKKTTAVNKVPAAAEPKANGAAKPAPKPAKKAEKPVEQKDKVKKAKLVRDSFTMPEAEYAVLGEVKKVCLKNGIEVKKSELLRVGVALIRQLDTAKLKQILDGLPTLKAGRPKKSK